MKQMFSGLVLAAVCAVAVLSAQAPGAAGEPFKLGRVRYQGRTFTALVLRETNVVDLAAAARAANQTIPNDLLAIIDQYESGVGDRLKTIVRFVAGRLGSARPAYVYELKSVDALAPFMPRTFLNAATNYPEHSVEMGEKPSTDPSLPGIWQRPTGDIRHNPYLFLSPPTVVTGNGDPIQAPIARSKIDWECELLAVIGKPTRRVPADKTKDYIWGYSVINDVSDRQNRDRDSRGMDWFVQKGQDTFKPFGPFIVSREFIDPLNTKMKFVLSGKQMQEDNTGRAIHNFYELAHYASNIMTLRVGDVIALGTPGGVGTARNPPIYMKPGDLSECTYEGIGTLTNPIVAEGAKAGKESF